MAASIGQMRRAALLLACGLSGCRTGDGKGGPAVSSSAANRLRPETPAVPVAGSRLKLTEPGSNRPLAAGEAWDDKLGFQCEFQRAVGGGMRCLPQQIRAAVGEWSAEGFFSDKHCSELAVDVRAERTPKIVFWPTWWACFDRFLPRVLNDEVQYGILGERVERRNGTEHPVPGDLVKLSYLGWRKDGVMFDRSVGRPVEISFGQVFPGWAEGLRLMVVGETRRLWIPAALAFGEAGRGGAPPGDLTMA